MNKHDVQVGAPASDPLLQLRDRVLDAETGASSLNFDVVDADGVVIGVVARLWPGIIGVRLNWRRATLVLLPVERLRIDTRAAEVRIPYTWGRTVTAGSRRHGRLVA